MTTQSMMHQHDKTAAQLHHLAVAWMSSVLIVQYFCVCAHFSVSCAYVCVCVCSSLFLFLFPGGAGFVLRGEGRPRSLRHVNDLQFLPRQIVCKVEEISCIWGFTERGKLWPFFSARDKALNEGSLLISPVLAINHKRLLPATTPGGFYLHSGVRGSPSPPHNKHTHHLPSKSSSAHPHILQTVHYKPRDALFSSLADNCYCFSHFPRFFTPSFLQMCLQRESVGVLSDFNPGNTDMLVLVQMNSMRKQHLMGYCPSFVFLELKGKQSGQHQL